MAKFDTNETAQWVTAIGGTNFFGGMTDLSVDPSGNIMLDGIFSGTIDFGLSPITANSMNIDIFLAKLTSQGQPIWSKSFDGGAGFIGPRMELNPTGVPVLAGFVSGPINFGTDLLTPTGSNDGFIATFAQ